MKLHVAMLWIPLLFLPLLLVNTSPIVNCPARCRCEKENADCTLMELTSVPTCADCTNIFYLDLSHNAITELPEDAFNSFPNLKYVFINHNAIHSIDLKAFSDLHKLEKNKINGNNLTQFDPNTFEFQPSLTTLSLRDNPLNISFPFIVSDTLKRLELSGCQLKTLPSNTFSTLTQLEVIILENNVLETLPDDIFQPLTKLKLLYLHGNPWRCGGYLEKLLKNNLQLVADYKKIRCATAEGVHKSWSQGAWKSIAIQRTATTSTESGIRRAPQTSPREVVMSSDSENAAVTSVRSAAAGQSASSWLISSLMLILVSYIIHCVR